MLKSHNCFDKILRLVNLLSSHKQTAPESAWKQDWGALFQMVLVWLFGLAKAPESNRLDVKAAFRVLDDTLWFQSTVNFTHSDKQLFVSLMSYHCTHLTLLAVFSQLILCLDLSVLSHTFKSLSNHASHGPCQENTGFLKVLYHCQGKITEREFLSEQQPKQFLMIMITMEKWKETELLYNMMKEALILLHVTLQSYSPLISSVVVSN